MDDLRELISKVKFPQSQYDFESHKSIYRYIKDHVPATRTVPPLDVTIYAIRNIMYPSLLHSEISTLLDLLPIVERYRARVLELTQNASVWNEYYKASADTVSETLTRGEESTLKRLMKASRADAHRKVYRHVVLQCCELDIYHLWHGQYPCIPVRLNEYFGRDAASPRLFRRDLSDAEWEELRAVGRACQGFWREALAWLAERVTAFRARGLSEDDALEDGELHSHKRDFASAFPVPVEDGKLVESIEWYVTKVQADVNVLERIFPT